MKIPHTFLLLALFCLLFCASTVSAQGSGGNGNKPGSVLFYNIYTSNVGSPHLQNTQLSVTNTGNDTMCARISIGSLK